MERWVLSFLSNRWASYKSFISSMPFVPHNYQQHRNYNKFWIPSKEKSALAKTGVKRTWTRSEMSSWTSLVIYPATLWTTDQFKQTVVFSCYWTTISSSALLYTSLWVLACRMSILKTKIDLCTFGDLQMSCRICILVWIRSNLINGRWLVQNIFQVVHIVDTCQDRQLARIKNMDNFKYILH